jgi:S-adenosylmethionine hydrolase
MRKTFACLLVALLLGCSSDGDVRVVPKHAPIVAVMTDFGTRDDAVALVKGVILSIARDAHVVDVTHEVPAFDIEAGAQLLEDAPGIYPPGTVFVVVVDPGVGTARKPIAVLLANGSYLVGPDNGVLSLAMTRHGVKEVRTIDDPRFLRKDVSTTFHGRDVFAPAAGHLALGTPAFEEIGARFDGYVKLVPHKVETLMKVGPHLGEITGLQGLVTWIDEPYGNVWTNISATDLQKLGLGTSGKAPVLTVTLGDKKVSAPLVMTFGEVAEGKPLLYWSSRGKLALALNMGDAARTYGAKRGMTVVVGRE